MGWVNKDSNVKMYQQGGSIEKKYKAGGDVKEETTPKSTYGKSARMDTKSGQFEAKPSTYGLFLKIDSTTLLSFPHSF